MSNKKKRVGYSVPAETASVQERLQQMRDRRAAADKIGRKPPQ